MILTFGRWCDVVFRVVSARNDDAIRRLRIKMSPRVVVFAENSGRGNSQIGAKDNDAIENITAVQLNYAGHHWKPRTVNVEIMLTLFGVIRMLLCGQGVWTWK